MKLADKNYTLSADLIDLPVIFDVQNEEQWAQKKLHGRHHKVLQQVVRTGRLLSETEGFVVAIQDQVKLQ